MKTEKHGTVWRVRKTYNKKTYTLYYDTQPSKHQAEMDMAAYLAQIDSVLTKDMKYTNLTVRKAINGYIDDKYGVLSQSTIRGYRGYANVLPEWFLDLKLKDVDNKTMQRCVTEITAGHSSKYVRNVYSLVRAVLKYHIKGISFDITLPPVEADDGYNPTEEDVKALLQYYKGKDIETALILGCYGVTRSEMCAITAEDVNGDILHIHRAYVQGDNKKWIIKDSPKNSKRDRYIAIPQEVADKITTYGRVPISYANQMTKAIYSFCHHTGTPRFSLHRLRHFFASKMSGMVPDATIMELGGWKTDTVMKRVYRYNLMREEEKKREASKMLQTFLMDSNN